MANSSKSSRVLLTLFLVLATGLLLLSSSTASAAPPIAKDGKIHACYKAKGKGKGTLRLVGSRKVRCLRKWKKVSWQARGLSFGPTSPGPAGPAGPQGEKGLPGTAGNVVVAQLEGKVDELLTRVEELETLVPTVQTLCAQAETLTGQINAVEQALGGLSLNGVLTTLGGLLNIPTLPGALPAFNCPAA